MVGFERPFVEIAERLQWHRNHVGLTQRQYAEAIKTTRSTFNNWESGSYRLSLDGALAIRRRFGVSLDFMYEGDAEALSKTLRMDWERFEKEGTHDH